MKKLRIDPIGEGITLRRRIERLFWGRDFLKLEDKKERERRLDLANRLVDVYGQRSRKFYRIYQMYCYYKGQLKGVPLVEDVKKETARIKQKIKKLFEEKKNGKEHSQSNKKR